MASRLFGQYTTLRNLLNQEARQEAPEVIVDAICRAGENRFGELVGALSQYQPGRPVPLVSPQLTTRASEELRPFQVSTAATVSASGAAASPAGMAYPLRLTAVYERGDDQAPLESDVDVVTEQRWGYRVRSLLAAPTQDEPIARVTADGWLVRPAPSRVSVTYYRYPTQPVLALQRDAAGDLVLDPETDEPLEDPATVDTEWTPLSDAAILRGAMEMLGLRTGDRPAQEYARVTAQQPS